MKNEMKNATCNMKNGTSVDLFFNRREHRAGTEETEI